MNTSLTADVNVRPDFDSEIVSIADYVSTSVIQSELAYKTAQYCLMDTLGCAVLALQFPSCTRLLGPISPGTIVPNGARVPATTFELDPIQAAFNLGTMLRWLDYNDTWLAAEWGHPSDNLGAILAVADYQNRQGNTSYTVNDILTAMIKAHEIQGILALENSFNRLGLDHVLLVRIASTAVATQLFGGSRDQIMNALSQAWIDGGALRTYRHAPNTGSRKSWAAGDATSRAVRLAWLTMQGEMGYPSALTAPQWGFNDVILKGKSISRSRSYNAYVMENVLFKVSYPAEFHAQTAVECAIQLHAQVKNKLNAIDKIKITTHESAMRIINKTGPLYNYADRDHSLQYMVAVALIMGNLKAEYYSDDFANAHPEIEVLRKKILVVENKYFSDDYLNPDKRSITNQLQIYFTDGATTDAITIEYPLGHKRRRDESLPELVRKFENNMLTHFSKAKTDSILTLFNNPNTLRSMPIDQFISLWVAPNQKKSP